MQQGLSWAMVPGRGWCPQAKTGAISLFSERLEPWASGKEQRKSLAGKSHSDAAGVSGLLKDEHPGRTECSDQRRLVGLLGPVGGGGNAVCVKAQLLSKDVVA